MSKALRIWSYPGIYPFPEGNDYTSGIFIHKQNLALKSLGAEIRVVLPMPSHPIWPFYHLASDWKENKRNARPSQRNLDGIPVFHPTIVSPKPSRIFKKPYSERMIEGTVKFLKKQGVQKGRDVILAQWLIPDGYYAVHAAKRLGIGCAVEMQGDDIQIWPHQSETHKSHALWVLDNADIMLGCSDFLGNEASRFYGKPLEVHTIYTGVDLDKFKPCDSPEKRDAARARLGLTENDIAILNVGAAIERKGWLELFKAVALIVSTRKDVSIKIVGASGGPKEFDLKTKAAEFGIADCIIDLGPVKNDQLPLLYHCCDIFCLPSHWEGLANALCEALASGCTVITTSVSGHPEVVKPGYNGELVRAKNVEDLVTALTKIIFSPQPVSFYKINARTVAESKIGSHETNAAKLLQLLSRI